MVMDGHLLFAELIITAQRDFYWQKLCRMGSVRISSPLHLSLTAFPWHCSILHSQFSILVLALHPASSSHRKTHLAIRYYNYTSPCVVTHGPDDILYLITSVTFQSSLAPKLWPEDVWATLVGMTVTYRTSSTMLPPTLRITLCGPQLCNHPQHDSPFCALLQPSFTAPHSAGVSRVGVFGKSLFKLREPN